MNVKVAWIRDIIRKEIREAAKKVLGWPDAEVIDMYGVPDRLANPPKQELGGLRLPRGPNSRDDGDKEPKEEKPEETSKDKKGIVTKNKSNNDNRH